MEGIKKFLKPLPVFLHFDMLYCTYNKQVPVLHIEKNNSYDFGV